MFNYDSFGPAGTDFTRVYGELWRYFESNWRRAREVRNFPDLAAAVRDTITVPRFWYEKVFAVEKLLGANLGDAYLTALWAQLGHAFQPGGWSDWGTQGRDPKFELTKVLNGCRIVTPTNAPALYAQRMTVNPISYGPFDDDQLTYMAGLGPIVEGACGSAYLMALLRERGQDAIGFDNNAYQGVNLLGTAVTEAPHPWRERMSAEGHRRVGSYELLSEDWAKGRTLCFFYPPPADAFTAELLRAYRLAFASEQLPKRVVFKVGGLIGKHTVVTAGGFRAAGDPATNLMNFFREVAQWWGPPQSFAAPHWNAPQYENGMFALELLASPRTLPDLPEAQVRKPGGWRPTITIRPTLSAAPPVKTAKARAKERKKKKKKK